MARRKNSPEAVRSKAALAERLRQVRIEMFGERGGPELARRLGLPVRTWYNYESGVTIPGEVLLRFLGETGTNPVWLRSGIEPRYQAAIDPGVRPRGEPQAYVRNLLETALKELSYRSSSWSSSLIGSTHERFGKVGSKDFLPEYQEDCDEDDFSEFDQPYSDDQQADISRLPTSDSLEDGQDQLFVELDDESMQPIVGKGALIAYRGCEEPLEALSEKLVILWRNQKPPVVRWCQVHDDCILLHTETSKIHGQPELIQRDTELEEVQIRRVLWVTTRH